ncbi:DgyrCDS11335 [Dimorphilus gyrociliatus]|uniref:DgyrCDS11335 n=1 Tax=Dimorphilus gyrociliatus TaxID=2664684 RepID=A0A7I8W2Y8_9ANNE|nr:DgyrCDS11335 [Dimorphilus gyrociliatus]
MPNPMAKDDDEPENLWQFAHDALLLKIFSNLPFTDVINASRTCRAWNRVSKDDFLWRDLFHSYWKICKSISKPNDNCTWYEEFKRLYYYSPIIECQTVPGHRDQVLHVSFSHNGTLFATSSKDGYVNVWDPQTVQKKFSKNMRVFKWKYTQFTQFNRDDTLLLVSGVHFGQHTTSGEIAVFSVSSNSFELQCRVQNKPYDIFGTWYNEHYLLSGSLQWFGNLTSCSQLWLNKASQAIENEKESVTKSLYKFYNVNASSIRTIMVADCPEEVRTSVETSRKRKEPCDEKADGTSGKNRKNESGAQKIQVYYEDAMNSFKLTGVDEESKSGTIEYDNDYRQAELAEASESSSEKDKYLIFTTGKKTYTPHQIGIKRIPPTVIQDGQLGPVPNAMDKTDSGNPTFPSYDDIDHLIELHGHIIGMCLSPDHRYLYVNSRPWLKGYEITDPLSPPPIAQEIDIHVIDLFTFKQVGTMHRTYKAYTPNDECFFIFLDVCKEYVSSGAEDCHGYLWDRHYGICLARYAHEDVVNSVAFNPKDSQYLITASDDKTFKIWRSRSWLKQNKSSAAQ